MKRWLAASVAVASLVACSIGGAAQTASAPVTRAMAHGRFTVHISADVINLGQQQHADIVGSIERALDRIDPLLPGPRTSIDVTVKSGVIPEIGAIGLTDYRGDSFVGLGAKSQVPFARTVSFWLLRTLAHEVHHQVRILAGPGFGALLLDQLVSEGTADVFEGQAVPGPLSPWDSALTAQQEHDLWARAQPDLQKSDLYQAWMFGDPASGIPRWAGFTIGYHIASGYMARHPGTTPEALAQLSSHDVVTGSGYQQ